MGDSSINHAPFFQIPFTKSFVKGCTGTAFRVIHQTEQFCLARAMSKSSDGSDTSVGGSSTGTVIESLSTIDTQGKSSTDVSTEQKQGDKSHSWGRSEEFCEVLSTDPYNSPSGGEADGFSE